LEVEFFIQGFFIGLSVAAPLGPIGILCLQRTFSEGHLSGLLSGLGISTADAICCFIAAFGLTALSGFLISQQLWLRLVGGAIVCILGVKIYLNAAPKKIPVSQNGSRHLGAYLSALLLTLMNPMLILSFTAIFASLGLVGVGANQYSAFTLVAGVFSGSAIWWIALSAIASVLRVNFTEKFIQKVNHFSGIVIVCFGLFVLGGSFLNVLS
jgi:threonine/homoserine/homoserine lactone efflux protein